MSPAALVLNTSSSGREGWPRRPAGVAPGPRLAGEGAGVAAAGKLGSTSLLDTVRTAFVHGMDLMLWTCGGIAVAGALLAVLFLPRRTQPQEAADGDGEPAEAA